MWQNCTRCVFKLLFSICTLLLNLPCSCCALLVCFQRVGKIESISLEDLRKIDTSRKSFVSVHRTWKFLKRSWFFYFVSIDAHLFRFEELVDHCQHWFSFGTERCSCFKVAATHGGPLSDFQSVWQSSQWHRVHQVWFFAVPWTKRPMSLEKTVQWQYNKGACQHRSCTYSPITNLGVQVHLHLQSITVYNWGGGLPYWILAIWKAEKVKFWPAQELP